MREFMHDTLLSPRSLQRGYFAPAWVKTMMQEHDTSRHDHHQRLWNLLTLELWHQAFIDGQSLSSHDPLETVNAPA
jgi:asparagine synthase (glutamine-hydrolysing)